MKTRYQRLSLLDGWSQERLSNAKVLVVGAGALGNEVLKNLALLGVSTIYICDPDTIEKENLCKSVLFREEDCGRYKAERAAEALRQMNPELRIITLVENIHTGVGLGVFAGVQVVFGCVDNRLARQTISRNCYQVGSPYVDGGLQGFDGSVRVMIPPEDPCYDCTLDGDARLELAVRRSCGLTAQIEKEQGLVPVYPVGSSIVGAMQVQEAIKILHGEEAVRGKNLYYYGKQAVLEQVECKRREDCSWHSLKIEYREIKGIQSEWTLEKVFGAIRRENPELGIQEIGLPRDYVNRLTCTGCSKEERLWTPLLLYSETDSSCPVCGKPRRMAATHSIAEDDFEMQKSIGELLPANEIVHVFDEKTEKFRYFLLQEG